MMTRKISIIAGTNSTASTVTEPRSGPPRRLRPLFQRSSPKVDRVCLGCHFGHDDGAHCDGQGGEDGSEDHLFHDGSVLVPASGCTYLRLQVRPDDGDLSTEHACVLSLGTCCRLTGVGFL